MDVSPALLRAAARLPSLPDIVQQMILSLSDDGVEIATLVAPLKRDQVMCARVLRLANSSFYAPQRPIGAIDEAVTLIGLNPLRNIVVAAGLSGAFGGVRGLDLNRFWERASAVAQLAQGLGARVRLDPALCFTAGLMQRIGQLVYLVAQTAQHAELAELAQTAEAQRAADAEQALLGCSHAQIGAALARQWQFPATISDALEWYLNPLDVHASSYAIVIALASVGYGLIEEETPENALEVGAHLDTLGPLLRRLALPVEPFAAALDSMRARRTQFDAQGT
jgi:HD-like signal output (HDOD) protein